MAVKKDMVFLLALVMILYGLTYLIWGNSPMYQSIQAQERAYIQGWLLQPWMHFPLITGDEREQIIRKYGFTESELSIEALFEGAK